MTQTTHAISSEDLAEIRATIGSSRHIKLQTLDLEIADAYTAIPRSVLADPWDRFIVATASVLGAPLVTRDHAIHKSELVETIW